MTNIKKRGLGVIKGSTTTRDIYNIYKNDCRNNKEKPIDYKTYIKIVKAINNKIVWHIVEEAEVFKMPYNLGELQIRKYRKCFDRSKTILHADWKSTIKHGIKIYYEDDFVYKWFWKKRGYRARHITWYKFKACRTACRLVPQALRRKLDYFR